MTRQFSLSLTLVFLYGPQIGQETVLERDTLLTTSTYAFINNITNHAQNLNH